MSNPLDILRAQAFALQAMADALLQTIDSMQARPTTAGSATMPAPAPTPPATAPAVDAPINPPGAPRVPPTRFPTFDGPVTTEPAPAAAPAREILPDTAGDLRPTTREA